MAEKHYSVQLINKREDGTQEILNPITKSNNVKVTPQNNIPETVSDLSQLLNVLGVLAFKDTEIDDDNVNEELTWSSNKLYVLFSEIDRRLKVVEDYLAQQEDMSINGTTLDVPTVCGVVYEEQMITNKNAAVIDNAVLSII